MDEDWGWGWWGPSGWGGVDVRYSGVRCKGRWCEVCDVRLEMGVGTFGVDKSVFVMVGYGNEAEDGVVRCDGLGGIVVWCMM